jgi:hypothetical protein
MEQLYYHLALNHLTIIIPIIAALVLIDGYAVRSEAAHFGCFCALEQPQEKTSPYYEAMSCLCTVA